MRQYVSFDISRLPIIFCKTQDFIPTLPEFIAYQTEYVKVMIDNPAHVQIFDLGDLKLLPSEIRISQGKWIIENEKLVKEKVKGIAFMAASFISRTVLKGIFIISKPKVPHVIVSSFEEAEEWCKQIMGNK
jgi:hypothetical protein